MVGPCVDVDCGGHAHGGVDGPDVVLIGLDVYGEGFAEVQRLSDGQVVAAGVFRNREAEQLQPGEVGGFGHLHMDGARLLADVGVQLVLHDEVGDVAGHEREVYVVLDGA